MPMIEAGDRVSPYFLEWEMTPIEREAWNSIRRTGMPFYPQCPIGGVFIDFGDPHKKLGIELDGAAYHDADRDFVRDTRLFKLGWRIFRITGRQAMSRIMNPYELIACDEMERGSHEFHQHLEQWANESEEGVLWAINTVYYRRHSTGRNERAIALSACEEHTAFDLGVDEDEIYEGATH